MTIPIPSNRKQFKITLGIRALYPVVIGIVVYDPTAEYTDYFRRKVTFRASSFRKDNATRNIEIRLPVSPDNLVLQVYNKQTLDEEGFKITKFDLDELPPSEIWASPEQHRFMDFAIRFAQRAGYVRPGFYHSPGHEFLIQYLPVITNDFGKPLITPARIHRLMPRVQLSQQLFHQFTIPVRVAILSHEGCHYFLNTRSEEEADECGLRYYLEYGFPTIEAKYALTKVFNKHRDSVGPEHIRRVQNAKEVIERFNANKNLRKAS